jgi:hypothetical protein
MKEVSIVAAKQSRNFSSPNLTIGLDLGDRSSWYCGLDETGAIVLEQKLSTTPKAMRKYSAPCRAVGSNTKTNPLDSDQPSHGRRLHSQSGQWV